MAKVGVLVSPTEKSSLIRALGRTSSVPERWGSDVLIPSLRCGAQRKEFGDFVSSLTDGRLAKEMLQMKRLVHRVLVVEGRPSWNADGEWMNGFQRFTLDQYWGALMSVQLLGVMVLHTKDTRETVHCIKEIIRWVGKGEHTSLSTRPKHLVSKWGTRDDADWAAFLLMGFEGIGAKTARAMVKTFGGAPLRWRVTEKELKKVPGVGKERARRLMRALGDGGMKP